MENHNLSSSVYCLFCWCCSFQWYNIIIIAVDNFNFILKISNFIDCSKQNVWIFFLLWLQFHQINNYFFKLFFRGVYMQELSHKHPFGDNDDDSDFFGETKQFKRNDYWIFFSALSIHNCYSTWIYITYQMFDW